MKLLAIIPARGGSKSIPRKNIINVGGKPLIAWSINASLKSKYITKTVVTSEDEEILSVAKNYRSEVVIRPRKYAQDDTPMFPVVKDCIEQVVKNGSVFDTLILLQPTSPLRTVLDIDTAIEEFIEKKATGLISGYVPDKTPFKSFRITSQGWLHGLVDNKTPFMNRQQLPKTFYPNGAIYIVNIKSFLKIKNFFTPRTIPFFMPLEKSVDVDSMNDLAKVRKLIKHLE